ncbi:MAG: amidohydrolase family protein [Candidatus Eremiobacteraeota bacterium]|nr:amidohydrolase family protein [Candidatus Eremiobacteraeota bacterium]
MTRIAALSAIPVMPSLSPTPRAHEINENHEFTAILGSTAFIGPDLEPLPNATILVRGNTIEHLGPAHSISIPDGAYNIDARGKYTIAGLIDSHVHFFQSGGLYTRPDAIDLRSVRPYTDELQWIRNNLHDTFARYVRAGITSVVDVGGPFWNYDVRTLARQTVVAPRVMAAGPLISSVDRSILDPYNDPPIVKIDTAEAARALIDRELAAHTDFVKFWWIVSPSHPAAAFQPVAKAAIDYAHQHGARVIIHATELETARLAVDSGTDILAHSVFDTDVDDGFIELLRSRNVIYCPTLIVVGNYGYTFHGTPNLTNVDLRIANPDVIGTLFNMQDVEEVLDPAGLAYIRALRAPEPPHAAMRNLKRVHDAGIRIAAGTDAGNIGTQHASSLYDEMLQMVASGLSPKDVLRTATVGGAQMMGRLHDLGTIENGKLADLVVLDENPIDDIRAMASMNRIIKDGHVFDATAILNESAEQVVQRQINAYNYHDAGVFAETYAVDAVVTGAGTPTLKTQSEINRFYSELFTKNPRLHAETLKRNSSGDTIIDRERVSGFSDGRDSFEATVTYRVRNGAITNVAISVLS